VHSALGCNVFTFALIGVIRGPILALISMLGVLDGVPGLPTPRMGSGVVSGRALPAYRTRGPPVIFESRTE